MNRLIFTSILCTCFASPHSAQEPIKLMLVTGHILNTDSTAIENAYLISYKTLRAFASNKEGYFEILLEPDDSLKIHHVSYKAINIKPNWNSNKFEIVMEYDDNLIGDVTITNGTTELRHMQLNMSETRKQLNKEFLSAHTKGPILNTYAPINPSAQTGGINLFELIDWIKHKRKQNP